MKICYFNSICVLAAVSVVLVGCDGSAEVSQNPDPATKNVSASNVSTSKASAATHNVDSQESEKSSGNEGAKVTIPDGFPEDIHVVDGAISSDFQKSGGKNNFILKYSESDNAGLVDGYFKGMDELGWTQVASSTLPIGTLTNFKKDDRKCIVSISPAKDELVTVAIVY